jgi:hypothetical protein
MLKKKGGSISFSKPPNREYIILSQSDYSAVHWSLQAYRPVGNAIFCYVIGITAAGKNSYPLYSGKGYKIYPRQWLMNKQSP